jgi:hypothetical protein
VVIALTIMMAQPSATRAQTPSPTADGQSQRVVVLDAGFALTFPAEWILFDPRAGDMDDLVGLARATHASAEALGIIESDLAFAFGTPPGTKNLDVRLLALALADEAGWLTSECYLASVPTADPGMLSRTLLDPTPWRRDDSTEPVASTVEVVGGGAVRVDYEAHGAAGFDTRNSLFLFADDATIEAGVPGLYALMCVAYSGGVDEWLPIAESVEFLPASE